LTELQRQFVEQTAGFTLRIGPAIVDEDRAQGRPSNCGAAASRDDDRNSSPTHDVVDIGLGKNHYLFVKRLKQQPTRNAC
jgi:hypothetical protein